MRTCLKSLLLLLISGLCVTARAEESAKVLPAEDARKQLGKEMTYKMRVANVGSTDARDLLFLSSRADFRDPKCLTVVVSAPNGKFTPKDIELAKTRYLDQNVHVTGKASLFKDRVQVKVAYAELSNKVKIVKAGGKALIAHIVYFTLNDNSAEAKQKLVDACDKYLTGHDGIVYYGTGIRGEEFDREVNDKGFDVALHLVFADKASHDKYQDHERHKQFIKENKDNWKQVRVFDSIITKK